MKSRYLVLFITAFLLSFPQSAFADIIDPPKGYLDIFDSSGLPFGIIALVGILVIGTAALIRKLKK